MTATIIRYIAVALGAYLIGSTNPAYFIACMKGQDMRKAGSGNLGTSNALVMFGWKIAVFVGLYDIGKGILTVLAARYLCPELIYIGAVAGVSCVLGHIFPFYLKFKGGKGFAAYLGMTIALNWKFAIVMLLIVLVVTLVTDYIVSGTVATMLVVPAYMGWSKQSLILAGVLCIASVVILLKHRENYVRIWNGTEIKVRSAAMGKAK